MCVCLNDLQLVDCVHADMLSYWRRYIHAAARSVNSLCICSCTCTLYVYYSL